VSGLQDIVKQKIDLIPEHEHNEHLRDQILKEAISL
jgi:predicted nucleotidyltransferase